MSVYHAVVIKENNGVDLFMDFVALFFLLFPFFLVGGGNSWHFHNHSVFLLL